MLIKYTNSKILKYIYICVAYILFMFGILLVSLLLAHSTTITIIFPFPIFSFSVEHKKIIHETV